MSLPFSRSVCSQFIFYLVQLVSLLYVHVYVYVGVGDMTKILYHHMTHFISR